VPTINIQLTDRDINILNFINEFGFCELPHIQDRFGIQRPRCYQIMQRLVKAGLVKHQRIFYERHGIFRVTSSGAQYTKLPALEKIPLGNYDHHLMVIKVYNKLRQLDPEINWISERRLIQEKFCDGVGKRGHLADGMIILPDGSQIAIEVELHLKGKVRTERILKGYGAQFSIKEVWYYCREGMIKAFATMTEKLPFVKVYNISEFLA
jgi:DNA-binding Lrp family transcriptional regulator